MVILDKWKSLLKKNQYLQLNEKNEECNRTAPIITIDTIEAIINDDEVYQKFIKFDNVQEIFLSSVTKTDYIKAVYDYADFMQQRGKQFSKENLKRIKKITGHKFKNSKLGKKVQRDLSMYEDMLNYMLLEHYNNEKIYQDYVYLEQELVNI